MTLRDHMATGATRTARAWALTRADGVTLGFTDHDLPLAFEGIDFRPEAGLSARALTLATGLSVDNSAALGALTSDAITEEDIAAGRYDGAEVTVWLVRWDAVEERRVLFRGTFGEITRSGPAFEAELRGLTEALNQPRGRALLRSCGADLGDAACGVDLSDPAYTMDALVTRVISAESVEVVFAGPAPAVGWFTGGLLRAGARLIKADEWRAGARRVTLWQPPEVPFARGHGLTLVAGCDKRVETCRVKFANLINFRGFPDMPGEGVLIRVPRSGGDNTGGSLVR